MNFRRIKQISRHLGWRWAFYRLVHAFGYRFGWYRYRLPVASWCKFSLNRLLVDPSLADPEAYMEYRQNSQIRFFFDPSDRLRFSKFLRAFDNDLNWAEQRLADLNAGLFTFFSNRTIFLGWPPNWHQNPFTRQTAPDNIHFSLIDEYKFGDVKIVWELSRFTFVYDLVRIYWRTGDPRCPKLFWRAVESWRNANPPNTGINWKCGQESSFRAMAWCFGLWAFADSNHSTAARTTVLAQMLAVTARRIERHLGYALSQNNNHGISEGLGLWTIGLLFPEMKGSKRWKRLGNRVLEQQGHELIFDDGSFSQYSANYHRVMLHDFLWVLRLADLNNEPFSDSLREKVVGAGRFLLHICDHVTGQVPRYGHDDGALILPLSNCDYFDFRPVIQATAALACDDLPFLAGTWNEELLWLFGVNALDNPVVRAPMKDHSAVLGGCHVLRSETGMVFTRCGEFEHRPSQMDLLHTDIWWRGINIAIDPGTYSYNATGKWQNIPFGTSHYHNTISVDGRNQTDRISRFLFMPWPRGTTHAIRRSSAGELAYIDMEHDGYHRLPDPITHRRVIVQIGLEHWLVVDRIMGAADHRFQIQWLVCDAPYEWNQQNPKLSLLFADGRYGIYLWPTEPSATFNLIRADENSCRGWYAPYYHDAKPALSIIGTSRATRTRFFTLFGPELRNVVYDSNSLSMISDNWSAEIGWGDCNHNACPVKYAVFEGTQKDRLEFTSCISC